MSNSELTPSQLREVLHEFVATYSNTYVEAGEDFNVSVPKGDINVMFKGQYIELYRGNPYVYHEFRLFDEDGSGSVVQGSVYTHVLEEFVLALKVANVTIDQDYEEEESSIADESDYEDEEDLDDDNDSDEDEEEQD